MDYSEKIFRLQECSSGFEMMVIGDTLADRDLNTKLIFLLRNFTWTASLGKYHIHVRMIYRWNRREKMYNIYVYIDLFEIQNKHPAGV